MKLWKYIFAILFLILALEVIAIFQLPDSKFRIVACNVGEGDATLLIYKNIQVLVDGGPDKKVLNCLGKYLPFWDRKIELVILTHPDRDHFTGLIDVFRSYKVVNFMYNPIIVSKHEYKVLENEVGRGGITRLNPVDVRKMKLGLIYLEILSLSEKFSVTGYQLSEEKEVSDSETNSYSIVSLVSFGKFRMLLTGDMTPEVSDRLAVEGQIGHVNYIKIPHHGSKNGLTQNLLEMLVSEDLPYNEVLGIISVGRNNYGHPADSVIRMLTDRNVKILRTDEKGDIEIVSNGEGYWLKN